jgi:hypothetical protein
MNDEMKTETIRVFAAFLAARSAVMRVAGVRRAMLAAALMVLAAAGSRAQTVSISPQSNPAQVVVTGDSLTFNDER